MSTSREIKILHLEPTDVCQAACPMCARETDRQFDRTRHNHLTIDQILANFPDTAIMNLDKMFMCGVYGDPAAGRHTMDIYRYFRRINPEITLGMNTNGAIQNTAWWQILGEIFHRERDYVVFSIDGLEDTNHIYRRGVDWHKLMDNVQAYIATGARAHWDMLVYRHNEHQVEHCETLARDLGFSWFRAKVSKRGFTKSLESPVAWRLPVVKTGTIQCKALQERSLYIDALGRASACCWLGARQSDFIDDDVASVSKTWHTPHPYPICQATCATTNDQSSFTGQWQREVAFV